MRKFVLSVVAASMLAGPAFAADVMAPKAPPPMIAVAPAPAWDIAFGTAFTSDYVLRGISQSNRHPALQGYAEGTYALSSMFTVYGGVWGSSLWSGFAGAEFDLYGGVRFSLQNFGLDIGYVYYVYTDPAIGANISYGEVYVKPSYKVTDWLTINGSVYWGDNFGNGGNTAIYYTGGAAIALPSFMPYGISTTLSGEVGRQTFDSTLNAAGIIDYTTWNLGLAFNYKAITLDLRYFDTDLGTAGCLGNTGSTRFCSSTFVATLKFDTTLSAIK